MSKQHVFTELFSTYHVFGGCIFLPIVSQHYLSCPLCNISDTLLSSFACKLSAMLFLANAQIDVGIWSRSGCTADTVTCFSPVSASVKKDNGSETAHMYSSITTASDGILCQFLWSLARTALIACSIMFEDIEYVEPQNVTTSCTEQ